MTAQNQRLVYWPMVKSGDYDLLKVQLDTYLHLLPTAVARTRHYWGHGGASFTEQMENFGLPNPAEYGKQREGGDPGVENNAWLEYEWDTALEFGMMALQAASHSGDSTFVTPGGWIQRGETLTAVLNYICAPDRSKGGTAWYTSTQDGVAWTAPQPLRMADGRPMPGILEQDPLQLQGGRTVGAAHFRPGLRVKPVYTDDPAALTGWTEAAFPAGEGSPLEPSQYVTFDGKLVMFFRDQASSFVKLASVSEDQGASWTPPMKTNIPDSRSKQCAGTLPDGRAFWVGNPTGNKSRRILVLALSTDGHNFDKAFLLAGPEDLPPRRSEGRYKTLGYNYPKAVAISDTLWISLSINKEDAVLYRVPLKSL